MTTEVRDNDGRGRFEVYEDGDLAGFAEYALGNGTIDFHHTRMDDAFAGRGLAKVLASGALQAARERKLSVLPNCSFIASFIGKNPGYLDLVPEDRRAEFELA